MEQIWNDKASARTDGFDCELGARIAMFTMEIVSGFLRSMTASPPFRQALDARIVRWNSCTPYTLFILHAFVNLPLLITNKDVR